MIYIHRFRLPNISGLPSIGRTMDRGASEDVPVLIVGGSLVALLAFWTWVAVTSWSIVRR